MTQPELPYEWYGEHVHGDGRQPHQHFGDHDGLDHSDLPLVPFDPRLQGSAEDLAAVLARLRRQNQQILQGFARDGVGINPMKVYEIRLSLLLEQVLRDPKDRIWYEIRFETAMVSLLEQMESEITRAKLTAPPPGPLPGPNGRSTPGGLIVPPGGRR